MNFWTRLQASIRQRDSLLCVGLDPQPGQIPARYATVAAFNRAIIEATADLACAFKPNIAFYEALGEEGTRALRETLAAIPPDIPVILDAKRGDIASTAQAYARAVYDGWGVDAVTVAPYLGGDGVAPFFAYPDKGVFVLCKTSNPSAGELQDWSQAGEPLYAHVAALTAAWAGDQDYGLVIGATYPQAVADIRSRSSRAWFLVPGVGTQGGELESVVQAGLRADGLGLIINASRSIMLAADPRQAASDLRAQINTARASAQELAQMRKPNSAELTALAKALFAAGCVRFGDFVLHSGAHSPIYVDLRQLVTYPRVLDLVARQYARLLANLQYDRIAAIPYAALPIGTAVALQTSRPLIYPRREAKAYGTRRQIEGVYQAGERAVLLDDLISSGGSKLEALEPLLAEGLIVEDVVVLLDREQGGREDLAAHGLQLHAALTLRQLVGALADDGTLAPADAQRVCVYLDGKG
jgi:uridine monophosphate synthetase